MNKYILPTTPPNQQGFARNDFVKDDFESLIFQRGYDIWHEPAILCPCKLKGSDNRTNCQNCGGSGWVFLNKTQTRMILHSMNLETKYKEWSMERLGTVSISCSDKTPISYMDKITLINSDSIYTQVIYPQVYKKQKISYLDYEVKEVLDCYMFVNIDKKLKRIYSPQDYIIDNNLFILDSQYNNLSDAVTISLRYRHAVVYHVIDINRDIMVSNILNESTGREEATRLPLSGIGRRAHYVLDWSKFNSDYILDNSYPITKTCL